MVTTIDIEGGVPEEPHMPTLALTMEDYRGKEINPIIAQAYKKFIYDEIFVKSKEFSQFLWRRNINNF